MANVSIVPERLFQIKPKPGSKFLPAGSWKTLAGHNSNTHKLRHRHAKNCLLVAYLLAGTINIRKDMTEAEIQKTWARITRVLREAGVVFWWIREVSRHSGRVHYHTIHTSKHTAEELKALIKKACPHLSFRLQFDPVKKAEWWSNYILKSTEFAGKESFHASKVVLFAEDCKLAKHGTIGDFWKHVPKKRTPQQNAKRRERRHQYEEAYLDLAVERAAEWLEKKTGVISTELQGLLAWQLVNDPDTYQHVRDLADQQLAVMHREELGKKPRLKRSVVGPYRFSPVPAIRKPPVRTKPKPPTPKVPFDPAKCFSIIV